MEVIIVASAISQLALRLCDKYVNSLSHDRERHTGAENTNQAPSNSSNHSTHEDETPEEGSIAALELRLKELRSEAKQLNSPDTFVQYARVSREANKLEKELDQQKSEAGIHENGLEFENMTRFFAKAIGPNTSGMMRRKMRLFVVKFALRIVVFSALWWYFSGQRQAQNGAVMAIDCRAVRPLAFLLSKTVPTCAEEDWVCAAGAPECKLPVTLVFGMCNVVLAVIAKTFT